MRTTAGFITRRYMASPTGQRAPTKGAELDIRLFCRGGNSRCPSVATPTARLPTEVTGISTTTDVNKSRGQSNE